MTLQYQFKKNGVAIPGATASSLSLSAVDVDDLGNPQVKTWDQRKSATHEFMERDGHLYVEGVYGEQYLPASVWVPLRAGGMTILSRTEFLALPVPVIDSE